MSLKHAPIILYSSPLDINSHRTRIILNEKGTLFNVIYIDTNHSLPKNLEHSVGSSNLPILVDRDLVLYNSEIIGEYLDERFPHPPLLPVYPVIRAKCRLMIKYFEHELYPLFKKLEQNKFSDATDLKTFFKHLVNLEEILDDEMYLMGDSFTLVDCCLIPLLYRLNAYNGNFLTKFKKLTRYASRVFNRSAFQNSLSEFEKEMSYEYGKFDTF